MRVRLATRPVDIAACKALIARIYAERYGVTLTEDRADPDGGVERFPDRFALGELDGRVIACCGLYTRGTYVERYGGVTRDDLRVLLAAAGVDERDARGRERPLYEYTKIVVDPAFSKQGHGRRFLAATHARAFLAEPGVPVPLLLVCARLSVFRLWDAMGIRTRLVKPFPVFKNHQQYRSEQDPMESRLVVPELDVAPEWFERSLPTWIPALPTTLAHRELTLNEGLEPVSSVDLRVSAGDLLAHWQRCWLTAEFLSGSLVPDHLRLTMVIDELLENAAKFCADLAEPVTLRVSRFRGALRVEARNLCDRAHAESLDAALQQVLRSDPETLFVEQLERTARTDRDQSRMGFISLCIHAGARLGVRIREARDGLYDVTVQVLLHGEEALPA